MRPGPRGPTRRSLLAGSTLALLARPAAAMAPEAATMLVSGPEEAAVARWAQRVGATLVRHLPHAAALRVQVIGAGDGLVAANRFATTSAPDGRLLLALSPSAALARAVGDTRARFDPSGWLPVCGAAVPAVLAGRMPLPRPGMTFRLGLSGPDAPETAALLVLETLGIPAAPVFGVTAAMAESALAARAVDAAFLLGPGLAEKLATIGAEPWFSAEPATGGREPTLAEVPTLAEMLRDHAGILPACRIGFTALRTRGLVVLPALTPAAVLGGWRQAGERWAEEEARESADLAAPLAAVAAANLLAALCPGAEAMRIYREWLGRRLNWRAV